MLRHLIFLFFFLGLFINVHSQQYSESKLQKADSLNKEFDKAEEDTLKNQILLALGYNLYIENRDTLIYYSSQVVDISKQNLERNDLSEREKYLFQKQQADGLTNIGYVHFNNGNYPKGLDLYLEGLEIRKKINDSTGLANSYNNIASAYNRMDEYKKALDYYHKSLSIRKTRNDTSLIALGHNNLAYTYQQLDLLDSALIHYEKSLELYEAIDYKVGISRSLTNLGTVFRRQKKYDKAMQYFDEGLKIRRKYNFRGGLIYSLQNIALLHLELNEYSKAKSPAEESYDLAVDHGKPYYLKRSASILYKVYKHESNYKKSLEMYELYNELKDSLKSEEFEKKLIKLSFQNEYEQKAIQDSIKNAEAQKVTKAQLAAEKAENEKKDQQAFFLYGVIGLIIIFGLFISNRFLVTRKQRDLIDKQKTTVEEKNKEILDSINYAKGIQEAILPPQERIEQLLKDHFVLYKPKDVVAGDFYWVDELDGKIMFAAADCTGHGVPGAMVSVVCHNALHRCIHEFNLTSPNEILDKTRDLVIETFESSDREVKDGMDIALCVWDTKTRKITYAGANNNLYVVNPQGQLSETKADKQPIGKYANPKAFTKHEIKVETGDSIYLFTDGLPDQFGGDKGKKLKYKNVKELFVKYRSLTMPQQAETLDEFIESWRGDLEQLDDICVIGVRV